MISAQQLAVKWLECAAAGAILLLLAKVAVHRLRQPADRIKVILMAIAAAVLVPLLIAIVPAWHLGIVAARRSDRSLPPSAAHSAMQATAVREPAHPEVGNQKQFPTKTQAIAAVAPHIVDSPGPNPTSLDRVDPWRQAAIGLVAVQLLATALLLTEAMIGSFWLRRMACRSLPADTTLASAWAMVTEGRGKRVRLLVTGEINTPLTYGCLRPTLAVPKSIAEGDPAELRFCLAHEWSHVEHGDLLAWRLAWFGQFVLWFQPLFWMLRRELRVCQDFVADHRAANAGEHAIEYSQLLVEFARRGMSRPVAGAMAFLDQSSQLSRRVKMLLASRSVLRPRSPLGFCLLAGITSLACAALLSAVRLESVEADEAPPANTQPPEPAVSKEQSSDAKATTPTPAEGETLHYTGIILDKETGKGIADATVVVRRSKLTSEENDVIEETRHTTDAEGKYSFDIPPEQVAIPWLYIELDVDHHDYSAQKGFGYALSMIRKNETLGERPFFEKVELRPSDPITGTVVAPDGKPLGGVKIQGYSKINASDFRDYGSFTDTVTDDKGKFRLNVVKGGLGVLWVLPTAYASTSRAVNKDRGDLGEIRLRPGVRVSGRVVNVEGQPVPNIPVNIQYEGRGDETVNDLPVATSIRRSSLTDQDGNFAFDPLPSGEYRLIPEERRSDPIVRDRTRYEIPWVFLPMKVTLKEGIASAPIEVQASPHVLFNAQILDSKGAKTRGHEVHVFGQMDGQYWFGQGRPNSEGTISMRIPHGLQNVQVNLMTNEHGALRFRRGKGKELENRLMEVELGTLNDDIEGFEIIRYRAPVVLVSGVDSDGNQVKDSRVTAAYPWGNQRYIIEGEQRSDLTFEHQNDGRYRTSQMLPDEDVKFTITAPGYEPASETVRLGEGETKDLVLTMKKS